jgi:hypothetical protein
MILKPREDSKATVAALERLMAHPGAKRHDIHRIRDQIDAIIRGDMSEGKAAHELDSYFGSSRNWMVIHDLRIEVGGITAQIDHLLLGRCLDVWVLESKRMSGGLKVLDNGECLTFRNGRIPVAIDSPMEQNRRHVTMLERLFNSGAITLPRRLGLRMKPKLHNLVLIAEGRITRPKTAVPGIENLIRTDLLFKHVEAQAERGSPLDLAKLVSPDTLEDLGRQLVAQHRPITYDWEQRFGIGPERAASNVVPLRASPPKALAPPVQPPKPESAHGEQPAAPTPAKPRPPAGQCDACDAPVSSGVKSYCRKHAERFDNRILCMTCQPVATAARA